jgi:hypothetical protein
MVPLFSQIKACACQPLAQTAFFLKCCFKLFQLPIQYIVDLMNQADETIMKPLFFQASDGIKSVHTP